MNERCENYQVDYRENESGQNFEAFYSENADIIQPEVGDPVTYDTSLHQHLSSTSRHIFVLIFWLFKVTF